MSGNVRRRLPSLNVRFLPEPGREFKDTRAASQRGLHRRGPARLGAAESELLARINRGLPEGLRSRYDELIARRRDEALTPEVARGMLAPTGQVALYMAEESRCWY